MNMMDDSINYITYISQKVQLYNLYWINKYIKLTLMDIFLQKQKQYNLHGTTEYI